MKALLSCSSRGELFWVRGVFELGMVDPLCEVLLGRFSRRKCRFGGGCVETLVAALLNWFLGEGYFGMMCSGSLELLLWGRIVLS